MTATVHRIRAGALPPVDQRPKASSEKLTAERLRELLSYNPDTGLFCRIKYLSNRSKIGEEPGCCMRGYTRITVDGKQYFAHRLAWLYVHGEWPPEQIDHINGIRHDNRMVNLRSASPTVNARNQSLHASNTSGFRGVTRDRNKWVAKIRVSRKLLILGRFDTPDLASVAYLEARAQHYPSQPIPREFL